MRDTSKFGGRLAKVVDIVFWAVSLIYSLMILAALVMFERPPEGGTEFMMGILVVWLAVLIPWWLVCKAITWLIAGRQG